MADYEFDDSGIYPSRPLEERWPPLGAAMDSNVQENSDDAKTSDHLKLQELQEEHEELNTSLISLTNHFAQVQFRLKQVVAAPPEGREQLLKALEEFAFQGCPDVRGGSKGLSQCSSPPPRDIADTEDAIGKQKQKQDRLIGQLKQQLEEMERCVTEEASNSLGDEMDPEKLIEKQRIVLEQLNPKLNLLYAYNMKKTRMQSKKPWARTGLTLDGFDKMSDDDVRRNVDTALGQVMHPKKKEELVKQLTSQIIDLERFVQFLQGEVSSVKPKTETTHLQYPCSYPVRVSETERPQKADKDKAKLSNPAAYKRSASSLTDSRDLEYDCDYSLDLPEEGDNGCCLHVPLTPEQARSKRIRDASLAIIRRALAILQIFAISQFGCSGKQIQDQILRKATASVAVPGYFELLAKLQASVENVARIKYALDQDTDEWSASEPQSPRSPDSVKSFSRQSSRRSRANSVSSVDTAIAEEKYNYHRDAELINAVRKDLAMALREVMQHGLVRTVESRLISSKSLVACIVPTTRTSLPQSMHIWEVFDGYYAMKHGREYNSTPASRLSEAFGIALDGSCATTAKQTLLRTLHRIKTTHEPCRRSMDAMFKSLVCAGLNQKTLVQWCRIVTRTSSLVDEHYQSWAYVIKSGMSEALTYLERLQPFDFHLPEDLAIRHLTKINDAFGEP